MTSAQQKSFDQTLFYREQALKCGEDATTSALPNVRARALRSQAAWIEMAERSDARDETRAAEAAKAAASALEPA